MHFIFYLEVFILISGFFFFVLSDLSNSMCSCTLISPAHFYISVHHLWLQVHINIQYFFHHNIYIPIYKSYFPSFGVVVVKRLGVRYITTSLWVLSFYPMWSSSPGTDHWSVDFLGVLCFPSPITWHILMTLIVTLCRV